MPVAALFVSEEGPYAEDPRFDAWGIGRDARSYDGSDPVVAHPPCERWGRMAKGSPTSQRFHVGDDGGCFSVAVAKIRANGGVLEHPQGSEAFRWFNLPIPPEKGWSAPDAYGGRSCYIDQGAYGHPAKKPTWLYAVLPAYPALDWTRVWNRPRIGGDGYHSARERARAKAAGKHQPKEQVPDEWRWRTPDQLKTTLYELAESARNAKPAATPPAQVGLLQAEVERV